MDTTPSILILSKTNKNEIAIVCGWDADVFLDECQLGSTQAESEDENQQRSNLVAALYDLEGEVEATVSTIKSLETSTLERLHALTADLQNFQVWTLSTSTSYTESQYQKK